MGCVIALLAGALLCYWVGALVFHWMEGRRTSPGDSSRRIQPIAVRGYEGWIQERVETTLAEFYLRGHAPGALKIFPWRVREAMEHRFGQQDIRVGVPKFDSRVVIKARPAALAHRLFSPERKAELVAAVEQLRMFKGFVVDLSSETLRVWTWPGPRLRDPDAQLLIRTATTFAEHILDLEQGAGVQWVEEAAPTPGVGLCQICGGELREQVVECAKCRTPHHRDCWLYLRQCSTYACKESRFRVDGRVFRPKC